MSVSGLATYFKTMVNSHYLDFELLRDKRVQYITINVHPVNRIEVPKV